MVQPPLLIPIPFYSPFYPVSIRPFIRMFVPGSLLVREQAVPWMPPFGSDM